MNSTAHVSWMQRRSVGVGECLNLFAKQVAPAGIKETNTSAREMPSARAMRIKCGKNEFAFFSLCLSPFS